MNTTPPFSANGAISCQAPAEITSTTETAFRVQLEQLIASAPGNWTALLIDLQNTRIIDSKGLNLVVTIVKRLRAEGRLVRMVGPQPSVRRILAFTRLDRHAEVVNAAGMPC